MPGTALDSWVEWKRLCALDLCSTGARHQLRQFGYTRFRKFVETHAARTNAKTRRPLLAGMDDAGAWHLFETRVTVKATGQGKRYKDWIFARIARSPDPPIVVIQSGATLIMRDAVREYLAHEFSPRNVTSLDAPLPGAGGTLTVGDLLPGSPDPVDSAAEREYRAMAVRHAEDAFRDMTPRERIAVLATRIGLPLSHHVVESVARSGKSMLSDAYRDWLRHIGQAMKRRYPDDDGESVLALTLMTVEHVKELTFSWGKSEMALAPLFYIVEGTEGAVRSTVKGSSVE